MEETGYKKGYGKRPLWQWVVVYLVVGLIAYAAVYYFVFAGKTGTNYNSSGQSSSPQQSAPAQSDPGQGSQQTSPKY